jgi:hypothetical protein
MLRTFVKSPKMKTLFSLLGFLTLVIASPVALVQRSYDVQPGDWTFKQLYDYVLQHNDSAGIDTATAIADFVGQNNLTWTALYNGNVSMENGAIVTAKSSAHGRAVLNNEGRNDTTVPDRLTTRQSDGFPTNFYGTISGYLWVADCSGEVAYTWTSDSIACVASWSGSNLQRMYSVRMVSWNTGLTITMYGYNNNANSGCKGHPSQTAYLDGTQCIASIDGRGFESVAAFVFNPPPGASNQNPGSGSPPIIVLPFPP